MHISTENHLFVKGAINLKQCLSVVQLIKDLVFPQKTEDADHGGSSAILAVIVTDNKSKTKKGHVAALNKHFIFKSNLPREMEYFLYT